MTQLDMSNRGLTVRRSMTQRIMGHASVALVYLGIVATFAAVTFVACLIWLLIG